MASSIDERALRDELASLAKKRELIETQRRGSNNSNDSRYSRPGGGNRGPVQNRRGSNGSDDRGNRVVRRGPNDDQPPARLGKRNDRGDSGYAGGAKSSIDKRPRLSSAVVRAESGRVATQSGSPSVDDDPAVERRKKLAVAPYTQKDGLARSRRMFGALMGHLGKAKAMIEKDSSKIQQQKTKQLEAEQKEKEQSKALQLRKQREAAVTSLEDQLARADIDLKEQLARTKLQHLQRCKSSTALSRFLLTVSSPPIYYLPAKHTKETEDLLAASMEAHKEKALASARAHESKLRELEASGKEKIALLQEKLEKAKNDKTEGERRERGDQPDAVENEDILIKERDLENDENENVQHEGRQGESEEKLTEQENSENEADSSPERRNADGNDDREKENDQANVASPKPLTGEEASVSTSVAPKSQVDVVQPPKTGTDQKSADATTEEAKYSSPLPSKKRRASSSDENSEALKKSKMDRTIDNAKKTPDSDTERERYDMTFENAVKTESTEETTVNTTETPSAPTVSNEQPGSDAKESNINENKQESTSQPEEFTTPRKPKLDVSKLRVTDLRQQLKKRGLDTKGLKANLIQRLEEALANDGDE